MKVTELIKQWKKNNNYWDYGVDEFFLSHVVYSLFIKNHVCIVRNKEWIKKNDNSNHYINPLQEFYVESPGIEKSGVANFSKTAQIKLKIKEQIKYEESYYLKKIYRTLRKKRQGKI